MDKLRFGTAGIPLSTDKPTTLEGIKKVRDLGLDALELEFVRSVNIIKEKAPEVKKTAANNDIVLTCHGQYFINLNSLEKEKIEASKERILKAARIAWLCGAWSVCFHAGFYMGKEASNVYNQIKKELKEILEILEGEGNKIWIRPETTGKATQFGSLEELLSLSQELGRVMPCIDFAHLHARSGKLNTYKEFSETLEKVEKSGNDALKNMHIHMAGIDYGPKGEKTHLNLQESDMKYQELLKAWKDFGVKGVVISESPNIEKDALMMKNVWNSL